jgi:hypothetical protein
VIKPRSVMTKQILTRMGVTDSDQNWERDSELGWRLKANQTFHHNSFFGEFNQEIRSDDLGLRVPLDGRVIGEAQRTILFVGDSVTAGFEVPYEETFVAKVERTLSRPGAAVRAINAGVRGYSTEQSLKMMKRLLGGMKPTDIVYVYSLNDPFENMNLHYPKRYMSKPAAYLDDASNLKFKSLDHEVGVYDSEALFLEPGGTIATLPVVDSHATPRRIVAQQLRQKAEPSVWDKSYIVGLVRAALDVLITPRVGLAEVGAKYPYIKAEYIPDDFGGFMPGFIDVSWEPNSYPLKLLEKIVVEMKTEAEAHGARFWLASPMGTPSPTSEFFGQLAEKYKLRVINPVRMKLTQPWVDKCGGTLVFRTDGHYTSCGHSGQAEAIATALATEH